MPRHQQYSTVGTISDATEIRAVVTVDEWCIEQECTSNHLVLSIATTDGDKKSFLLSHTDAQDIGDVLRRRAGDPARID